MGIVGRAFTYVATSAAVSAGGYVVSNQVLPESLQPKHLAAYIELYAKRQQNPLLTQKQAMAVMQQNGGSDNPLEQMEKIKDIQNAKAQEADLSWVDGNSVGTPEQIAAIKAREAAANAEAARIAEQQRQVQLEQRLAPLFKQLEAAKDVDARVRVTEITAQIEAIRAEYKAAQAPQQQTGSGTVVVANNTAAISGAIDPHAEQRIRDLMVPDDVKKQIWDTYHRTGILPEIMNERTPASNH